MTVRSIKKLISRSHAWVKAQLSDFEPKQFSNEAGDHVYDYNSPAAVAAVKEFSESQGDSLPEGWRTVKGIAKHIGRDSYWVKKHLPALLSLNPSWQSDQYLDSTGRPGYTHYAPELISRLKDISDAE